MVMGTRCVIFKSHVIGRASERFAISLGVCAHHCVRARACLCVSLRAREGETERERAAERDAAAALRLLGLSLWC